MEGCTDGFDHSPDCKLLLESLLYSAEIEESDLCDAEALLLQDSADQLSFDTLKELDSLAQEVDNLQLPKQCLGMGATTTMASPKSPCSLVASLKSAVTQPSKVFVGQVVDAAISLDCQLGLDSELNPHVHSFYSKLMEDAELSQTLASVLDADIEDYEYEFIWTILQFKEREVTREVEEFRTRLSQQQPSSQKLKPQLSTEWVAQIKQAIHYKK